MDLHAAWGPLIRVWWEHNQILFLKGAGGGLQLPGGVGAGHVGPWLGRGGFWVPQGQWGAEGGLTIWLPRVLRA